MINLLPLTKVISAIAVLYTVFILIILFFNYNASSNIIDGIVVALKGATALNLILLSIIYFGWRWVWRKLPFLNQLFFPDLNGQWSMIIHWQRKEDKGMVEATAYIKQDLLKISMEVDSKDSESVTLLAKPKKDPESGRAILYYVYRSTPKRRNGNDNLPYDGTAVLKLDHNSFDVLKGNYYTDRLTTGHYELKRKST